MKYNYKTRYKTVVKCMQHIKTIETEIVPLKLSLLEDVLLQEECTDV
jgi:hypothetical protein